jgi:hypothetical protein
MSGFIKSHVAIAVPALKFADEDPIDTLESTARV